MTKYNAAKIEAKWQKKWEAAGMFKTPPEPSKAKRYVLDMFPYPSGSTMHVGHLEGYIATDIISRYLRMKDLCVLHPMGWDAFGLPAENYAIKTGINPKESTQRNIETFKRQLKICGLSYDWDREIDTSSPEFYKWTQWLFILLYRKGLAYKKKAPVNWCPKDETVLANEQVINGLCERCDTPVVQKELDQWFFKITKYADRLVDGLKQIDWLDEVKLQQINWIGQKKGIVITYPIDGSKQKIACWTSRPDTNFGATFIVISPNHPLALKLATKENKGSVSKYIKNDNHSENEKTGVFTGSYAVNQLNSERLPIWISNYVVEGVGTGAVVGVPGHDKRDFEFAQKFGIKVARVVASTPSDNSPITKIEEVQEDEGVMVNSEFLNGLGTNEAKEKMMEYLEEKGWGKRQTHYHLRDWLISRQRYWGAPIPMVYCQNHNWQPVPESQLPILLPDDVDFLPHGSSPIATSKKFQEGAVCPVCGKSAVREVDTMDTFVDSSWYFIRFVDPKNNNKFADKDKIKAWLPVDIYVGGGHVVQHLLFSRFFWKVLYDEGYIEKSLGDEPFLKLRAPGWILGPDSRKMSKRWGNVITPDDIIPKFGADVLRLYEMFMGPFDVVKPWNITGVEGMHRFVQRVWGLLNSDKDSLLRGTSWGAASRSSFNQNLTNHKMHQTIKKVTNDIEDLHFNTAISSIMEYVNALKEHGANEDNLRVLTKLIAPFAPHLAEEVWQGVFKEKSSIHQAPWPEYDEILTLENEITVVIQVNGKVRDQIVLESNQAQDENIVKDRAHKSAKLQSWIGGKKTIKEIFIPGKIFNIVVE
jgi:leucyl-tRNA synthetase